MNSKRRGHDGRTRGDGSGGRVWDTLNGLSAAVGGLTNITASLIPFLSNSDLIDKIQDRDRFMRLARTLDNDVRASTADLRRIQDQHRHKKGSTFNQTEWMQAVQLQEQYIAWAAEFDDTIIPTFSDMVDILRGVGADVCNIARPSAISAVDAVRNNS